MPTQLQSSPFPNMGWAIWGVQICRTVTKQGVVNCEQGSWGLEEHRLAEGGRPPHPAFVCHPPCGQSLMVRSPAPGRPRRKRPTTWSPAQGPSSSPPTTKAFPQFYSALLPFLTWAGCLRLFCGDVSLLNNILVMRKALCPFIIWPGRHIIFRRQNW